MRMVSGLIAGALLTLSLGGCPSKEDEQQSPPRFVAEDLAPDLYFVPDSTSDLLARYGQRVLLERDGTGTYLSGSGSAAMRWSVQEGRLVLDFSSPLDVTSCIEDLADLPNPPITSEVEQAYRTEKGRSYVDCTWGTSRITFTPLSGGVLEAVRVEHVTTTKIVPFTVGGVTYDLDPIDVTQSGYTAQLRIPAPVAPVPFTADSVAGTWAMDVFNPAWRHASHQSLLTTDLLTFTTDGNTGTTALTGKTFTWRVTPEGDLELSFPDGSKQLSRILDSVAALHGVFTEQRDSSGVVVAGSYGYAMKQPPGFRFQTSDLETGSSRYWQSLLNAWLPEEWENGALRWESRFGWVLEAAGQATRLTGTVNPTTQQREMDETPMTWSVTAEGQFRVAKACPQDPDCRYRLWWPLGRSEDGTRIYVLEREYERTSATAPYTSPYVPPRINVYERMTRPTP